MKSLSGSVLNVLLGMYLFPLSDRTGQIREIRGSAGTPDT